MDAGYKKDLGFVWFNEILDMIEKLQGPDSI